MRSCSIKKGSAQDLFGKKQVVGVLLHNVSSNQGAPCNHQFLLDADLCKYPTNQAAESEYGVDMRQES